MNLLRLARSSSSLILSSGLITLALGLGACDGGGDDTGSGETETSGGEESGGPRPTATEAECDATSTLTYESFGAEFMQNYCTGCHDSTKTGGNRFMAPIGVDFDTQELIQGQLADIDSWAGASGDTVNEFMPPMAAAGVPRPSLTEREDLAVWLACGAL